MSVLQESFFLLMSNKKKGFQTWKNFKSHKNRKMSSKKITDWFIIIKKKHFWYYQFHENRVLKHDKLHKAQKKYKNVHEWFIIKKKYLS